MSDPTQNKVTGTPFYKRGSFWFITISVTIMLVGGLVCYRPTRNELTAIFSAHTNKAQGAENPETQEPEAPEPEASEPTDVTTENKKEVIARASRNIEISTKYGFVGIAGPVPQSSMETSFAEIVLEPGHPSAEFTVEEIRDMKVRVEIKGDIFAKINDGTMIVLLPKDPALWVLPRGTRTVRFFSSRRFKLLYTE